MLPRVDYVDLSTNASLLVAWDDFLGIAGDVVVREPGVMPARWRTTAPLGDEVRQALLACVVREKVTRL